MASESANESEQDQPKTLGDWVKRQFDQYGIDLSQPCTKESLARDRKAIERGNMNDPDLAVGRIVDLHSPMVVTPFPALDRIKSEALDQLKLEIKHFKDFEVCIQIGSLLFYCEATALTKEIAEADVKQRLDQLGIDNCVIVTVDPTPRDEEAPRE